MERGVKETVGEQERNRIAEVVCDATRCRVYFGRWPSLTLPGLKMRGALASLRQEVVLD